MENAKDLIVIAFFWVAILYFTMDCRIAFGVTAILVFTLYFLNTIENKNNIKEIDSQREYFVETLIHDLKIPTLAQLRGLEVIKKGTLGELNPEQKDLIGQIESSCNYVLEMISMVLKTYHFENGRNDFIFNEFNLQELAMECVNELSPVVQQKNIEFSICDYKNNTVVRADRENIKTVILNMLSNSILYAEKNQTIDINIKQNSNKMNFEVKSIGDTLTESECSRMFTKTNGTPRYTTVGYGISLYLCKKIIDGHFGTIYAKKEGKNVNKFAFTLPQDNTRGSAVKFKRILLTFVKILSFKTVKS